MYPVKDAWNEISRKADLETFYMLHATFTGSLRDKPSGIIDAEDLFPPVGEDTDTLLAFMSVVSAMQLNFIDVIPGFSPSAHHFGVDSRPIWTLFRARKRVQKGRLSQAHMPPQWKVKFNQKNKFKPFLKFKL